MKRGRVGVLVLCAALIAASGCGGDGPTLVEDVGLERVYIAVFHRDEFQVLRLENDGSFTFREGVPEGSGMGAEGDLLAEGQWADLGDSLELSGDGWRAVFVRDSTRVEVPGRADTVACLRWVGSSEHSPFSAVDLVSRGQFINFIRPPEGSGSEGG